MRASEHDKRSGVMDPVSGLPSVSVFRLLAERKLALARRTLTPISALVLQIERDGGGRPTIETSLVANELELTLRASDTLGSLGPATVGVLLDDTAENGAVWAADRCRRALRNRFGRGSVWTGVACYPTHAFEADGLILAANAAAKTAANLGPWWIEVAEPEPAPVGEA